MSVQNTVESTGIQHAAKRQAFRKQVVYPATMHILMFIGVFIVLFPLLYAIVVSTQTMGENYQKGSILPGTGTIENYELAWERGNLGRLMINTLIVALSVSIGKIILSITAAFALIYFRLRGGAIILGIIMLTHFLPLPVRIVPTYDLLADLNWINTFQGLSVPFFASATGVLLFQQFYRTVPTDMADAARVDGAGPIRFLFHILIPVSLTNIGALFLIEFIYMWNQYLWPLIVGNVPETRQVQIGIKQLIDTTTVVEWNVAMAGSIVVIIPPLIVLLVLQRSLMTGLTGSEEFR
jgi:sn-glycerol 3-phosphate transport system permease protein